MSSSGGSVPGCSPPRCTTYPRQGLTSPPRQRLFPNSELQTFVGLRILVSLPVELSVCVRPPLCSFKCPQNMLIGAQRPAPVLTKDADWWSSWCHPLRSLWMSKRDVWYRREAESLRWTWLLKWESWWVMRVWVNSSSVSPTTVLLWDERWRTSAHICSETRETRFNPLWHLHRPFSTLNSALSINQRWKKYSHTYQTQVKVVILQCRNTLLQVKVQHSKLLQWKYKSISLKIYFKYQK